MMRRRAVAAALLVVIGASSCVGGRDALTIYSGREEALVGPLLERFARDTGISIDVRYGDSADLALLIAEEGDSTPADVFFSQSPGTVGFLADKDLLGRISRDEVIAAGIGERWVSARDLWVAVTARQRVLVYNNEMVSPADLPDSVFDLTAERYAGKVGLAPANASFQDFVTAMRQLEGEDAAGRWLTAMAEAGSPTYADNISIVDAVGRGEIPMGLVNHYYNFRFLEEEPGSPARNYVFPNRDIGALLIASTVAKLESGDERAQEFVEYVLSPEAQRYFAEETFEYPLVDGVEPIGPVPPLDPDSAPEFDIDRLGGGLKTTVELIESSGLLE